MSTCDLVADVEAFAAKFGLVYDGKPRVLPEELANFRQKFLKEELREYTKAMYQASYDLQFRPDLVSDRLEEMLDALADLVYVAIGTALMHGFDFREAWRRVQAANMAKVRAERLDQTKRGTLFDVVKPPGWQAPSHEDLVADHAHRGEP